MSYIDCFPHEIVGLFGSLPVYHPLVDIEGTADPHHEDFPCTTRQLVLGGGGGEHPGMVLRSSDRAVAEFLIHNPEIELSGALEREIYEEYVSAGPEFHFAGWSSRHHHDFYHLCVTGSLPHTFNPDAGISFETWLLLGFGEFIFYAMPELAPGVVAKLSLSRRPVHTYFNNILAIPPRMPVYAKNGNAFFKD